MLLNYKVNKNSSASNICKNLVIYIERFVKKNHSIQNIVKEINSSLNIPEITLNQKIYQIIFRDFNFKENKFERYNLFYLIEFFVKYFFICFLNIVFHKKTKKKKKFDLICDNVFDQTDVDRYSKLVKIFKNVCLLGSFKTKKKIKSESYFRYKLIGIGTSDQDLKSKFFYLKLGIKILNLSIIDRTNYFRIFFLLTYDILKSKHIFSKIESKYYLTNKFYATSPILNFYFKKAGGLKTSCFQKNILAYSLSCFVFSDILFTLGKGQGMICMKLGGKIKEVLPVGSLFMEGAWFNKKKDLKNVPTSNVLILGINTLKNTRHHVNKIYSKNYYDFFLNWINKLAVDFPNLKIILKHHNDYMKDPIEKDKLLNSKVDILVKNKSENSSYAYAYKSELILSFASTMILETLGLGKKAYFIDPNLKGSQWFDDIKKNKKLRLGSYQNLKKVVLNRKKLPKINKFEKDFYCLDSNLTSERIAKNLVRDNKI